jgi:hypothetical protein
MERSQPTPRSSSSAGTAPISTASSRPADPITQCNSRRAFLHLQELETARVNKRARHGNDPLPESARWRRRLTPLHPRHISVYGRARRSAGDVQFHARRGLQALTPREWLHVHVSRGNKCHHPPMDVFFMALGGLNNCG